MGLDKIMFFGNEDSKATLAVTGELDLTAVLLGTSGNNISFAIADAGVGVATSLAITGGTDIVASIDVAGAVTAADLVVAIEADSAVSALISAVSTGTTVIAAAVAEADLTGGAHETLAVSFNSIVGFYSASETTLEIICEKNAKVVLNISANKHKSVISGIASHIEVKKGLVVIGDDSISEYINKHITSVGTITQFS